MQDAYGRRIGVQRLNRLVEEFEYTIFPVVFPSLRYGGGSSRNRKSPTDLVVKPRRSKLHRREANA